MIKSIRVQRATVGTGILEPVQCSKNSQIAVNNSDHITILEPKLPLLHQCVSCKSSKGQMINTLDASSLYDVRTIFHVDNLESLGLQIFSRILIEDGESSFSFGRIAEPMIVGHKWSPLVESRKDCYLGVLLNTGEVLVLARDTLDASKYEVKFRSFTSILDQMKISQERLTSEGDIIIPNSLYLKLKINSFDFGQTSDGRLFLCLSHESNEISIHELSEGLPTLETFDCGGLCTKQVWSQASQQLFYLLNDNSIHMVPLDVNGRLKAPPQELKSASRFLVSQMQFIDKVKCLLVADTQRAVLVDENGLHSAVDLPYRSVISGMPIIETLEATLVHVAYESGKSCMIEVSSDRKLTLKPASSTWTSFLNNVLYKYQLKVLKEQNKAPSKVFQPYWTDNLEANFYNYGTQTMASSGVLVSVYSLAPKNVIHHEIKSKMEFSVSFLPLKDLSSSWNHPELNVTSLSFLHGMFMQDINGLPQITQAVIDGSGSAEKDVIDYIKDWKRKHLGNPRDISLNTNEHESFHKALATDFRNNMDVKTLQRVYSLNTSLMRTFNSILKKRASKLFSEYIVELADEQDVIGQKLRQQLARIILDYAKEPIYREHDMDIFISSTFAMVLGIEYLPDVNPTIKLSSELCTESFNLETTKPLPDDFLKFAKSTTGHKWPRCELSFLPILTLLNKSDELELQRYSSYDGSQSIILRDMYKVLDYCIYTGNRTFSTKIGV
ncbi:hypothetical protein E0198_002373 [Clavispora lusitaniae]|nr:hypothetical protein E0198_002373 [Clavispora lusitaniae]